MRADPRGIVSALRRAVREGNRGMEDFLADEIAKNLERLDAIEARAITTSAVPHEDGGAEKERG